MAFDPIPTQVQEYLDSLVPARAAELQAMEAYAKETSFPIIGPSSGQLCYQVARMIGARRAADGPFDLIFNDIDKHRYPASLPVIAEKLRPGGVLIIDNMLWHGNIFDAADHSADTEGVREFTQLITTDPAWIASLVPIRDGLIVAYKK